MRTTLCEDASRARARDFAGNARGCSIPPCDRWDRRHYPAETAQSVADRHNNKAGAAVSNDSTSTAQRMQRSKQCSKWREAARQHRRRTQPARAHHTTQRTRKAATQTIQRAHLYVRRRDRALERRFEVHHVAPRVDVGAGVAHQIRHLARRRVSFHRGGMIKAHDFLAPELAGHVQRRGGPFVEF